MAETPETRETPEQREKRTRKTTAIVSYVLAGISTLSAIGWSVFEIAFFKLQYEPLAEAGRLNEGDRDGCVTGLAALPVLGVGYLVGGVTMMLALIALGFGLRARNPWGALVAILCAAVAIYVGFFAFGL